MCRVFISVCCCLMRKWFLVGKILVCGLMLICVVLFFCNLLLIKVGKSGKMIRWLIKLFLKKGYSLILNLVVVFGKKMIVCLILVFCLMKRCLLMRKKSKNRNWFCNCLCYWVVKWFYLCWVFFLKGRSLMSSGEWLCKKMVFCVYWFWEKVMKSKCGFILFEVLVVLVIFVIVVISVICLVS